MKSIAEKGVVPDVSIDTDSSPGHELDMEDSPNEAFIDLLWEILQLRWFSNRYVNSTAPGGMEGIVHSRKN